MRRPAQHHRPGPAAPGWVHPYTGLPGIAVFYNDGGQGGAVQTPPAPVPSPSPADLANRAPQSQPAAAPPATAPAPQAGNGDEVLLDHRTNTPMTQAAFAKIMAKENAKGRRAALRELAESAGVPFTGLVSSDADEAEVERLAKVLKDAEASRQERLTEEQRQQEELASREKALEARETAAAEREAAAAKRDRDSKIEQALVRLGATGDDLKDAALLISVPDNADDNQITEAAEALKKRREALFGAAPAPQTLPPAPSGGPAGGNAPRQPAGDKDAINEAAKKMAIERGLRAPDPA